MKDTPRQADPETLISHWLAGQMIDWQILYKEDRLGAFVYQAIPLLRNTTGFLNKVYLH